MAALAAVWAAPEVHAIPTTIPYLGYLVHDSGAPVHGMKGISVSVLDAELQGNTLWGPYSFVVSVNDGLFTLPLGETGSSDLASALDSGAPLWLEFAVDGTLLAPRQRILSVPYARRAQAAEHLGDEPASAYVLAADLSPLAWSGDVNDLSGALETSPLAGAFVQRTGDVMEGELDMNYQRLRRARMDVAASAPSECTSQLEGLYYFDTTDAAIRVCIAGAWTTGGGTTIDPPPGPCLAGQTTLTTPGSQEFTVPEGCSTVTFDLYGAGGGGACNGCGNGGGSGGGFARKTFTGLSSQSRVFSVAVGGPGLGTQSGFCGSHGGDTVVIQSATSVQVRANGGLSTGHSSAVSTCPHLCLCQHGNPDSCPGGTASGGDINHQGGAAGCFNSGGGGGGGGPVSPGGPGCNTGSPSGTATEPCKAHQGVTLPAENAGGGLAAPGARETDGYTKVNGGTAGAGGAGCHWGSQCGGDGGGGTVHITWQ